MLNGKRANVGYRTVNLWQIDHVIYLRGAHDIVKNRIDSLAQLVNSTMDFIG